MLNSIFKRLKHASFVFGYLWLLLTVYTLHNSIIFPHSGLLVHLGAATLKASVFTKFVLIGEHLKLGSRVEKLPLIWPILVKAALFSIVLIGFDLLEVVLVDAIWPHATDENAGGLSPSNVPTTASLAVMAFISLIPFFGIRELVRVVGEQRMRDLFFRDHSKSELRQMQ